MIDQEQNTIQVHVGPRNGRPQRLVIFQADGREYRDSFDSNNGFARQKAVERVASRFSIPITSLGYLDAAIVEAADVEDNRPADDAPAEFTTVSCAELAAGDYAVEFLIDGVLAEGIPTMVGGQLKSLKSMLSIAMGVSLATGEPFLGTFDVLKASRVVYFIGEGGLAVAQDYARRIAASHGIELADIGALAFCDRVPQLASLTELDAVAAALMSHEATVAILDPLYLMLDGGRDSGNIMAMGPIFRNFNRVCANTGVTPIIVHHLKKNRTTANTFDPPELAELAWSGAAEFAGGWVLVGRREPYDADNPGEHKLHLVLGGRAGHSGRHALDVHEGRLSDPFGRRWEVDVLAPRDADQGAKTRREEAREAEKAKQLETDRTKVVRAMVKYPDGETKTTIRDACGMSGARFNAALASLISDGTVVTTDVLKGNHKTPRTGYKLAEGSQEI